VTDRTLTLPARPPDPARPGFPLLATLAPVAGSLALWAITGSVFALAFAALGPLVAVASVLDARRTMRRGHRDAERRLDAQLAFAGERLVRMHAEERAELAARAASRATGVAGLVVGEGRVRSAVRTSPEPQWDDPPGCTDLRARAGVLDDAPVVVAADEVLVAGGGAAAAAVVRALAVQLLRAAPTGSVAEAPPAIAAALSASGVRVGADARLGDEVDGRLTVRAPGGARALRTVRWSPALPPDAPGTPGHGAPDGRVAVVDLTGPSPRLLDAGAVSDLLPVAAGRVQAAAELEALAAARGREADAEAALPDRVELAGLPLPHGDGLPAVVGVAADGPVVLDLVADGPHAVVGGTTGSGKSELLATWMLAMAAVRPARELALLLVDFKGGATFGALAALPHVVGLLTDLDEAGSRRALASLTAELRHRERVLAEAGLPSIEGSALPRLVVAVDEYAALADQLPDAPRVFADLAARGRSLGVHLVLCTQRPAGALPDALLANAGLRVSLRVLTETDSLAVVGLPDAARLSIRGRAVVATPSAAPRAMQVALAGGPDRERAAAWPTAANTRPPWLPPLPAVVIRADLPPALDGGIPLGLADLPAEQRRALFAWHPDHGHLLVVGAPGCGRSTALDTVVAGADRAAIVAAPGLPGFWDAVQTGVDALDGDGAPRLLVLDDVDARLAAADDEIARELLGRLHRLLREGPGAGLQVALSAGRIIAGMPALAALCRTTLVMRTVSPQEHLLAGGGAGDWEPDLPPGAGRVTGGGWSGARVQIALGAPRPLAPGPRLRTVRLGDQPLLVAVSSDPERFGDVLRAAGAAVVDVHGADPRSLEPAGGARALLGSPDAWQGWWGALAELRRRSPMLVDGCTPAELRGLVRGVSVPPPCAGRPLWVLPPGSARPERAELVP